MEFKTSKYINKILNFQKNKEIPDETIEKNLLLIESFFENVRVCNSGPMSQCKQIIKGTEAKLLFKNGQIYIKYRHCPHWFHDNPFQILIDNFLFANYEILSFTYDFQDYINEHKKDEDKTKITQIAQRIDDLLNKDTMWKGLYIHGKFGVGKTYILKTIANSFAKKNKKVVFITANEIIKKVKETFSVDDTNDSVKIEEKCKKADILFIDDIGAESVTEWSRDEILFDILNYRMEHKKITFFSSNKNIANLEKTYLSQKIILSKPGLKREEAEYLKAARFCERIKAITNEIELEGKNKRY